jgi:hypothetical protein
MYFHLQVRGCEGRDWIGSTEELIPVTGPLTKIRYFYSAFLHNDKNKSMHHFRLPLNCKWDLRSYRILHGLEDETSRLPETLVTNYHSMLYKIPEVLRSQKQIQCSKHFGYLEECIQGNLKSTAATGSSPKCKLLPDYKASQPRKHNSLVTTATSKSRTTHSVQSTRQ